MGNLYVCGVVLDEQGRVVLVKKAAGTPMAGMLNFPGGRVEPDENLREAVSRELGEETGVAVPPVCWSPVVVLRHRDTDAVIHFFAHRVPNRISPVTRTAEVATLVEVLSEPDPVRSLLAPDVAWITQLALAVLDRQHPAIEVLTRPTGQQLVGRVVEVLHQNGSPMRVGGRGRIVRVIDQEGESVRVIRVIPLSPDDIQDGDLSVMEAWSKMDWGFELGRTIRLVDEPSQT